MIDTKARSVVKTVSWRLTGSGATFLVSWILTGNFAIAGTIAVMQMITNTALYYIHERIWVRVQWGRRAQP